MISLAIASIMNDIRQRIGNPLVQAALIISACLMTQLIALILSTLEGLGTNTPWVIAGAFTLFYAFFSAVLSLKAERALVYFSRSIYGYLIVLVGTGLLAYAFSNFRWETAGSMSWIYFILTFSYLVFITIAYFMRKIIDYAQRKDTEHKA